ncbi:hypothetical protein [Rhizobium sp. L43]|uniref:hypothetical protein n=1 Tax=Rhizobium sp. L43 TaxID=2035452 RepID=UPI000BEA467B|nr:hypothetical protein [Rhizobium sp. L43]PDS75458.1 hypothetical protein CO667_26615 [Rhizobium sp. L43]
MKIENADRYKQLMFNERDVDKQWDKQVWFWNRPKIVRFWIELIGQVDVFEFGESMKPVLAEFKALHGIGMDSDLRKIKVAFPDKKQAMLFKLAHGGGQ